MHSSLPRLLNQLRNNSCTNGFATLTKRKSESFGHGHRVNQIHFDVGVIARYHHLHILGKVDVASHISSAEEKLRSVGYDRQSSTAERFVKMSTQTASEPYGTHRTTQEYQIVYASTHANSDILQPSANEIPCKLTHHSLQNPTHTQSLNCHTAIQTYL